MGLFSTINTAATGLTAQRLRQDVIADNIANANTTRTTEGGAFRRSRVVFRPRVEDPYWKGPFLPEPLDNGVGQGVRVVSVEKDYDSELTLKYDPTHPRRHKVRPPGRLRRDAQCQCRGRDGRLDLSVPFLRGQRLGDRRREEHVQPGPSNREVMNGQFWCE